MSCPYEHSVAAFGLGTLDADERADVAAHLPTCATCSGVRDALAGVTGLLARVPADRVRPVPPPPGPVLDRVLAAAAAERARRTRQRRLLAVAAALLLLAGTGSALLLTDGGTPSRTVRAESGGVQAEVTITQAAEGSDLRLRLAGVPPAQTCRLVAVAADGRRDVTATWQATYAGQATITGHSALEPAGIDRLVVETDTGRTLVDVPVPG